jgi:phage gpG-like protein
MPLIRTGEMLRSIHSWMIAECEAGVGTPDEKAPYHEFGTATIPKRAFLYPALAQSIEEAKDEFKKLEDALYG